ncbi:MAG TPA: molybdenum cofactor guanylyltransferase [Methanocorpusculum sp.]|nr:molybdenum cofactor guanylyltransferase [Methanocorpusculum sp.]
MTNNTRSIIILAGGEGKRVGGRKKYLFCYKGQTFIDLIVQLSQRICNDIVIVTKNSDLAKHFEEFPVKCTWDRIEGLGPIGGIHAGISEITGKYVFITACDMPTINYSIVKYLFEHIENYDAIIPKWNNGTIEPLHAVYNVLETRNYFVKHDYRTFSLRDMVNSLNTNWIDTNDLRFLDKNLDTFRNINTMDDLQSFESI